MIKAIRRLFGLFALLAVIFGALKSVFQWLDHNADEDHEIFAEEEEHSI